ncbi:Pseudouridine synthase family protein, partial [Striga hermonthica]
ELETENVKLSVHLSRCACQKEFVLDFGLLCAMIMIHSFLVQNLGSGQTSALDCTHSVLETKGQRIDENDIRNRSEEQIYVKELMFCIIPLRRLIAIKVMYFGQRFYGFASEAQMDSTIELEVFKALEKTRLISGDKKELNYSRCGRTDKGVSSVGQVISLFLRSNGKQTTWSSRYSVQSSAEESYGVLLLLMIFFLHFCQICISHEFIEYLCRFSCLSREYKYFFWRENLNITLMEIAGMKFIGEHDFRNFCKMDAANVHNYRRQITSFEIIPCSERFEDDELWALKFKGSAFLWHHIRCMAAVLFLISKGLESPDVSYWDIERTPIKPKYRMAPEIPLVLRSCEFEGLEFKCSSDAAQALRAHLEKECPSYKLQAAIFHEALLSSSCASY